MVKILDFFRLIRIQNLLIIALTQYLIRYTLILGSTNYFSLTDFQFFLLVLSTVLIAAGGNIINDYFDTKVDFLNKRKVIIGKTIKRRWAIILHWTFSATGVFIGFYLANIVGLINLGFINLFCAASLWFYSVNFKRNFLIGNLLISLLSALVLILIPLYELIPNPNENTIVVFYIVLGYSFFAFSTTLIREIIKDFEDIDGDKKMNYKTFAIKVGEKKAIQTIQAINTILFLFILFVLIQQFNSDTYSFLYVVIFIALPYLFFIIKLTKIKEKNDFHYLSQLMKIIMLTGIMSMLVFSLLY
jgi:4-hydroxybenzoate polyprenyltransferase